MNENNKIQDELSAFVKRQLVLLGLFLVKIITPIGVLVVVIIGIIMGAMSTVSWLFKGDVKGITVNASNLNLGNGDLKPQTKVIKVKGIDYPMPRIGGLSKKDFYALMVLRVSEFGNKQDFDLAGMEDSCSLYQQRVSELLPNGGLSIATKELLGDAKYNAIFNPSMSEWIKTNSWTVRKDNISVTSGFGNRDVIETAGGSTSSFHGGTDFGYAKGTPVVATFNGMVVEAVNHQYGNVVVIKHDDKKIFTLYLHLDSFNVKKGDNILAGQQIALSGNSGQFTTAPHLHYQVMNKWGGLDGYWYDGSVDALKNHNETLYFLEQPFYGACRMLQYEQINNGFFDKLQIKRFESRSTKYKDFDLSPSTFNEFTEILVRSHAPREDTIPRWKNDALNWLTPAYIDNSYQKYLDAYK
jgi:peptidoglycan LD-endopeptidase LytH